MVDQDSTAEEWRDVHGFVGLYRVSSLGQIMSVERKKLIHGSPMRVRERILKQCIVNGYPSVHLSNNGWGRMCAVHRLVGKAFLSIVPPMTVNHRNGNKRDNRLANLEACTIQENIAHAFLTGLRSRPAGERNPTARLSVDNVRSIRTRLAEGIPQWQIAGEFGVGRPCISKIASGKRWKHVPLQT